MNISLHSGCAYVLLIIPGHFRWLQDLWPFFLPEHFSPPYLAVLAMVLILDWTPFPQLLEHDDHIPQEDQRQSTETEKTNFENEDEKTPV